MVIPTREKRCAGVRTKSGLETLGYNRLKLYHGLQRNGNSGEEETRLKR